MSRRARWSMWFLASLAWAWAMWFVVFPWIDATFVSRPEI